MNKDKIIDFKELTTEKKSIENINEKEVKNGSKSKSQEDNREVMLLDDKGEKTIKKFISKQNKKIIDLAGNLSTKPSNKDDVREVNLDILNGDSKNVNNTNLTNMYKIFAITFCLIVGFILFINLPIFNVKTINLTGNSLVTKDEILRCINYNKSSNFFSLFFSKIDKKIRKLPQVDDVKIKYSFPNEIDIQIEEMKISGYIPYLDDYIFLDATGKVIAVRKSTIQNVPLIEGLTFTNFMVGQVLDVEESESLGVVIELANIFSKYGITDRIKSINIYDIDDIRVTIDEIEVIIGKMDNGDYKIREAIEILTKLNGLKGFLDVSSSSNRSVFTPFS